MEKKTPGRTRIIGLRLTMEEYRRLEAKRQKSTCRKLSDYVRKILFDKPVTTLYRNQSLDEMMAEASRLRSELNSLAGNFNQAVKKLHGLHQIGESGDWLAAYESERQLLLGKVEEIKNHIQKMAQQWLSHP
ncbi:MAG: plasmid mobilization relaxosome protein MobC [Cytophagales bacterium]|jgi:hypothetical protein|nr:plasmid mobilization relaxosome protein MobC [Cytophagales bacterium]